MDYSFVPVTKEENRFKSTVSDEIYEKFKYIKGKTFVVFEKVYETEIEDFELAEKTLLPIACKELKRKLFFNLSFKRKLVERVEQILS